jgi:CDP-diacylglycerol---glycerol-3-phosphate 3-phosphatidyltransferase
MNIPNLLTLSRIFLTVILWFLCDQANVWGAFLGIIVFTVAAMTDFFDGFLARKLNQTSSFGKILDPIADKLLILTAMFIFASQQILSWWMVILIAVREILVTASRLFLFTEGKVIPAEAAGKVKTIFQMITISLVLVYRFFWLLPLTQDWMGNFDIQAMKVIHVLMIATLVLTWWSGGMYFRALRGPAAKDKK